MIGRALLVMAAVCSALAIAASPARAAKQVDFFIGGETSGTAAASPGSAAGEFFDPDDVAVNESTGQIYVVENSSFNPETPQRIQRFDADGDFELAFGRDVLVGGGTGFEICTVASQCQKGEHGSAAGELQGAIGIEIDQASGDLFVGDSGSNARVQQFGFSDNGTPADLSDDLPVFKQMWGWDVVSEGAPGDTLLDQFEVCTVAAACKAGSPGSGAGQLSQSGLRVAVAPVAAPASIAGHVFVADRGNRRIHQFDPDAATPAAVFVGDFGSAGTGVGQFSTIEPQYIAIDEAGIVYASDQNERRVQRYDTQATPPEFLAPIAQEPAGPLVDAGSPKLTAARATVGLEVDMATGHLLVARDKRLEFGEPVEEGAEDVVVQELDLSVEPPVAVATHFDDSGVDANTANIGVNGAAGTVYVAQAGGTLPSGCHCVPVLDDDGAAAPLPSVTIVDPSGREATVQGAVDSNGSVTTYRVEISKDGGATWTVASPDLRAKGDAPQPFTHQVEGLEANAAYRARVTASKPFNGPSATSNEVQFTTDTIPPDVTTEGVANRTDTTVRVVAKVNANNLPTSYRFEYTTEADFQANGFDNASVAPDPDASAGGGGQVRTITQTLTGLDPESAYRYRVVAANAAGTATGDDEQATTRRAFVPEEPRAYEMVTPPFKITRSIANSGAPEGLNANPGIPSLDGEAIAWSMFVLPLQEETRAPFNGDNLISRRTANGWQTKTFFNIPVLAEAEVTQVRAGASLLGASGDMSTTAWGLFSTASGQDGVWGTALLPYEGERPNQLYTRKDGTGTEGWTGWLSNPEQQATAFGLPLPEGQGASDQALLADDGSWMLRWGFYRGVLGLDPQLDPSVTQDGGRTAYFQTSPPEGEIELVGECTGTSSAGDQPHEAPTEIPVRNGTGGSGDTIGMAPCEAGSLTSKQGASVAEMSLSIGARGSQAATSVSRDGKRIFFHSPDASPQSSACTSAVGLATHCPPQLYVRQLDSAGRPIVRWVSRSQVSGQAIGLYGRGAAFQGASADGRHVYFQTNSPLTADDPNGQPLAPTDPRPIQTGAASNSSWDLYRYTLPESRDEDPDEGELLRVSGGPSGNSDPNTNPSVTSSSAPPGASARFVSDDGRRAYFVTAAPIDGADHTLPLGATTAPGGTPSANSARNLYLFDDTGQTPAWRFVARLPGADSDATALNECAMFHALGGQPSAIAEGDTSLDIRPVSCVRGVADGSALAFMSFGQLTDDDDDDRGDIYLYDAVEHELTRVTAPPPSLADASGAPRCKVQGSAETGQILSRCNGIMGVPSPKLTQGGNFDNQRGWGGARTYNLARDDQGVLSVFFDTTLPLVPEDVNGDHWDVYQWREGRLSLVSPGDSDDHSWYSGNSTDGEDVFLFTSQRIDPREVDDHDYDIYDARRGSEGFPRPPQPAPCDVLALACEDKAIAAPPVSSPATPALRGSGNVTPRKGRRSRCGKNRRRQGKRCVAKRQCGKSRLRRGKRCVAKRKKPGKRRDGRGRRR